MEHEAFRTPGTTGGGTAVAYRLSIASELLSVMACCNAGQAPFLFHFSSLSIIIIIIVIIILSFILLSFDDCFIHSLPNYLTGNF